jgi:ssDNA-binding Zn-finger/Zn-ribbon topoisomerase 1
MGRAKISVKKTTKTTRAKVKKEDIKKGKCPVCGKQM